MTDPYSLRSLRVGDECVLVRGASGRLAGVATHERVRKVGRKWLYVSGAPEPVDPDTGRVMGGRLHAVVRTLAQHDRVMAERAKLEAERLTREVVGKASHEVRQALARADDDRILAIHAALAERGLL